MTNDIAAKTSEGCISTCTSWQSRICWWEASG